MNVLPAAGRTSVARDEVVYEAPAGTQGGASHQGEEHVKRFMLLHFGFEKPTQEIMAAWGAWFESLGDRNVGQGGFMAGTEISSAGPRELPMGPESITGYNIIEAASLEEAVQIARGNPYISSIRVYEIRSG
jgi:hypothetical protein